MYFPLKYLFVGDLFEKQEEIEDIRNENAQIISEKDNQVQALKETIEKQELEISRVQNELSDANNLISGAEISGGIVRAT